MSKATSITWIDTGKPAAPICANGVCVIPATGQPDTGASTSAFDRRVVTGVSARTAPASATYSSGTQAPAGLPAADPSTAKHLKEFSS